MFASVRVFGFIHQQEQDTFESQEQATNVRVQHWGIDATYGMDVVQSELSAFLGALRKAISSRSMKWVIRIEILWLH